MGNKSPFSVLRVCDCRESIPPQRRAPVMKVHVVCGTSEDAND
jgi:hypothetical protein